MTVETIPNFFIKITSDEAKELVCGDIRTKQIIVPLDGDYTMWTEEDEIIIEETI
jgi:hypothetical protein